MSAYTDSMVAALEAAGSFTYDEAVAFAEKHDLSTRSVISKIKSLGLDYAPKPKAAKKASGGATKAQVVAEITTRLGADPDALSGLVKSDAASLVALLKLI